MVKIGHLAMCTKNNRRLVRFYRLIFGMEEVWNPYQNSPYAFYIGEGRINLNCLQIRPGSSYNKWIEGREVFPDVGINHVGFQVESMKAIEKRLADWDPPIQLETSPQDGRYEEKRFVDPDGNLFEFAEGPWDAGPIKNTLPIVRHVSLCSRDHERLAYFYQNALGMKDVERVQTSTGGAAAVFLSDGQINLGIVNDPSFNKVGLRSIGFRVASVEEIRTRLKNSPPFLYPGEPPIEINRTPLPDPYDTFYLKDPDGNIVHVSEKGWGV